jgi:hypothetical protein
MEAILSIGIQSIDNRPRINNIHTVLAGMKMNE